MWLYHRLQSFELFICECTTGDHQTTATTWYTEYSGLRSYSEAYAVKLKAANIAVNKILLPGQTHNPILCWRELHEGKDPAGVAGQALLEVLLFEEADKNIPLMKHH